LLEEAVAHEVEVRIRLIYQVSARHSEINKANVRCFADFSVDYSVYNGFVSNGNSAAGIIYAEYIVAACFRLLDIDYAFKPYMRSFC